jgi:PAS domain S-box-containing protein
MAATNQKRSAADWPTRLWAYATTVIVAWTAVVAGVLVWELRDEDQHMQEIARAEAEGVFEVDHLFRRWNAEHGGVYVPVTEQTRPNPALADHAARDVTTPEGRELTLVNPSYMMRQVRELAEPVYALRGGILPFEPEPPVQALDDWQAQALRSIRDGAPEVFTLDRLNGHRYVRLMRPLVTDRRCMQCHREDGYELGKAAGVVSVSVPIGSLLPLRAAEVYRRLLGYGAIWLLGMVGISVGTYHIHRQVGRRRQAERQILQRDQRFADLVTTIPGVVYQFLVHPDGSYEFPFISSGVEKVFGVSPEEVQQNPLLLYPGKLAPGEFLRVHPSVLEAARKATPWNGEIKLNDTVAGTRWVRVNATPKAEPNGDVLFSCVLSDISSLKEAEAKLQRTQQSLEFRVQARTAELQQINRDLEREIAQRRDIEEALRQSEANYREIFDAVSDGIVVHDAETFETIDANPAVLQLYGYAREDFLQANVEEFSQGSAPYDQQHAVRFLREAAAGKPQSFQWHARRLDDTLFWVEVNLQRATVAGRRRVLAMVRDITDRKTAEEALRRSEEKYRELYQNLRDGWVAVDLEGRFTEFNRAYLDMLGYSAEELRQLTYHELTPERWHEFEAELVRDQVFARGYSELYEKEYRRKDGTVFPVELQAYLMRDHRGEPVGLWGLVRDITERRRQEAATREAQAKLLEHQQQATQRVATELQKVRDRLVRQTQLATIGQVSASIAHELRNPLGVIRNAVFLLRRKLKPAEQSPARYLQIIEEETATADQIISDLMAMSRGKPPSKSLVSLEEIIHRARARCPNAHDIRWELEALDEQVSLYVDPAQMEQVFRNLFANSIQSMEGGGTISVSAGGDGQYDQIVVADTGPGIPEDQREHIFEPLYTTKSKGTGLGLTICHQIIERHGGTIDLDTKRDGAVFRIRLPRAEPAA